MAESKIDFSFENLHFACEGDKNWVEAQLNQILDRIPGLYKSESFVKLEKTKSAPGNGLVNGVSKTNGFADQKRDTGIQGGKLKSGNKSEGNNSSGDPLFEFLKEKNADKNQVKKFLATAVYLHTQGADKFSTSMVSKSLKASHIDKLLNASDCLNKNEKKGFCIKDDKEFILTEGGFRSIIGQSEEK
ncbi:MAG: hypothetical protein WCL21_17990 [Mariniphaga sp.]